MLSEKGEGNYDFFPRWKVSDDTFEYLFLYASI
jgi:hypothetical protein